VVLIIAIGNGFERLDFGRARLNRFAHQFASDHGIDLIAAEADVIEDIIGHGVQLAIHIAFTKSGGDPKDHLLNPTDHLTNDSDEKVSHFDLAGILGQHLAA
jgi:hypothetical protein